jgi:hypothetical protein
MSWFLRFSTLAAQSTKSRRPYFSANCSGRAEKKTSDTALVTNTVLLGSMS